LRFEDVAITSPAIATGCGNPGRAQLVDEAILKRAVEPLAAAARLRRVGGNVLDAQLRQGSADLGEAGLVDVAPFAVGV